MKEKLKCHRHVKSVCSEIEKKIQVKRKSYSSVELRFGNGNSTIVTSYQKLDSFKQTQETYNLSLPPRPHGNTWVVCGKMSKSSSGLKGHMKIHKTDIPQLDPINPVQHLL